MTPGSDGSEATSFMSSESSTSGYSESVGGSSETINTPKCNGITAKRVDDNANATNGKVGDRRTASFSSSTLDNHVTPLEQRRSTVRTAYNLSAEQWAGFTAYRRTLHKAAARDLCNQRAIEYCASRQWSEHRVHAVLDMLVVMEGRPVAVAAAVPLGSSGEHSGSAYVTVDPEVRRAALRARLITAFDVSAVLTERWLNESLEVCDTRSGNEHVVVVTSTLFPSIHIQDPQCIHSLCHGRAHVRQIGLRLHERPRQ